MRQPNAVRLAAVDARAARLGLAPGLALADARARVPTIVAHPHAPGADAAFLRAIGDWCERYTPVVAEDAPDGLTLEIAGSAHLFGGEAGLLHDLAGRLRDTALTHRAAIAGTPDCARALARFGAGGIVAAGGERQAVSRLPVAALRLDRESTLALQRIGIAAIADLAERPRKPLTARFGPRLIERLEGLLGQSERPITPCRPAPAFFSTQHFAEPIGLADDIAIAFEALTRALCRQLESHRLGGRSFAATFFRADGARRHITALAGRPLRDAAALKRLFMTRLETLADPLDPDFGFDAIRLAVHETQESAPAQTGFDGTSGEEEAVAELLDRLTARFGPGAVERFLPRDSHVPERAARRLPAIAEARTGSDWPAAQPGEPPHRPLLLFTPPQPIETLAEVPEGPPLRFRWRRALHEIVRAEGPERIAPEWWRGEDAALERDYYRAEDGDGRRFWLFRHGLYGRGNAMPRWFIHGLFS